MEDITSLISNLGFPIGISLALFYFLSKFLTAQMDASARREQALMDESKTREERYLIQMDKFSENLNNFNITLTKIDTRLASLEQQIQKDDKQ